MGLQIFSTALISVLIAAGTAFGGADSRSARSGEGLYGEIRGRVADGATGAPLPGANVEVVGKGRGDTADPAGRFAVSKVEVGAYVLRFSMVGYEEVLKADVIVRSGRATEVSAALREAPIRMQGITVTPGFFQEMQAPEPSRVAFSFEEVRRSPGSAQDVSRLLQALPSVSMGGTDQRNDLIVRGGSPTENMTRVDGIQIPNISHFPTQGASGGAIGLLNVDLIEEVDFTAGGFSARYGDRLSSVMEVDLREGNRTGFEGEVSVSMAGAGAILEGPMGRGRGSWLVSARRSYLDLLPSGSIGLTAVPVYSDVQGKAVYDLGERCKITLLGIAGTDHITFERDEESISEDINQRDRQMVGGINWRVLWNRKAVSHFTLSQTYSRYIVDVEDEEGLVFRNRSTEQWLTWTGDLLYKVGTGAVSVGVDVRHPRARHDLFQRPEVGVFGYRDSLLVDDRVRSLKAGAFLDYRSPSLGGLTVNPGVRVDHFWLTGNTTVSPRLALRYQATPSTALKAAGGLYHQSIPLIGLSVDRDNRTLPDVEAVHGILGMERLLGPDVKLSLEGYVKLYRHYPVDANRPERVMVNDYADFGFPRSRRLIDGGKGRVWGMEVFLQKKLAERLYGSLSYSYSRSKFKGLDGVWRVSGFDTRHLFTAITGYRWSRSWEFSLRWSYAGGRPYTPIDLEASRAVNQLRYATDPALMNSRRFPAYHRLDLRFDHRKSFRGFNVVTFFSLQNAYARGNVFAYYWNEVKQKEDVAYQFGFLPVGGVEVEF